ncbi:hypothetical protein PIB30_024848 [Stylosanthes scabra]|uniref:Pectinesterase n=1 Tax=Stylosanthes scabra TaxID=79078 RepID=A0ABU6Z6N5_9FABA|nr:hypothetical protein [Stylosanthes scabra]
MALTFMLMLLLGNFTTMAFSASLVRSDEFVGSVSEIIGLLRDVVSILSKFSAVFVGNSHLNNAILDSLKLLDLSSDELDSCVSAIQNSKGTRNSTQNALLGSDLTTWLSAVLANLDTITEGFQGTTSIVTGLISTGLRQVTSLVKNLLLKIDIPRNDGGEGPRFPSWAKPEERKLLEENNGVTADVVVAADGTGNFTRVTDAVLAAPEKNLKRFVIYVKRGIYNEYVEIDKNKWNIVMIGDGIGATVITGNRNVVDGWTTFGSATFAVIGRGFIARDITFENTAGPEKKQAVALRTSSDLSIYFRCEISGYQDSLFTQSMRQFFRECKISGTVDFIFGDATAFFQKCNILVKKGLPKQRNAITAQGRIDPNEPTGFSLQFCNITADSDLIPFVNTTESFLGRPWKQYSRTVFLQNYISDVISPQGWTPWNESNFYLDTLYYAEYMNTGPGAGIDKRVKWPGYRVLKSSDEAGNFTVAKFIEGNLWLPSTGVAFTAGFEKEVV